jgi:hypothetical protein
LSQVRQLKARLVMRARPHFLGAIKDRLFSYLDTSRNSRA